MKLSTPEFKQIKFLFILLFIALQVYLIFLKRHYALDIDVFPNTIPSHQIYGDNKIGQTFTAQRNNLARIDVNMATYGRDNDKNVYFRLWEQNPRKKLAAEIEINASEVKDNSYKSFKFKPQRHSNGKTYSFIFSSPGSNPDNSISVWMNKNNIYRAGDFLFNNTPSGGDLNFRVYSKRPISSELGRIVRNYHGIFGSIFFLILSIVFFEVISILFLAKLLEIIHRSLIPIPSDKKDE